MLVPRIIIEIGDQSKLESMLTVIAKNGMGVYLQISELDRTTAVTQAQEAKRLCLHVGITLLLDDLEIAALVNADGVCCEINDDMYGRAKDVIGEDKLVGGTAHSIQDVANLYEEGMVDFAILKSYIEEEGSENILGKQKSQLIIDDARLMGYDIPIVLQGGINLETADEALSTRAYGIMTPDLTDLAHLGALLLKYPLR